MSETDPATMEAVAAGAFGDYDTASSITAYLQPRHPYNGKRSHWPVLFWANGHDFAERGMYRRILDVLTTLAREAGYLENDIYFEIAVRMDSNEWAVVDLDYGESLSAYRWPRMICVAPNNPDIVPACLEVERELHSGQGPFALRETYYDEELEDAVHVKWDAMETEERLQLLLDQDDDPALAMMDPCPYDEFCAATRSELEQVVIEY